MHSKTVKFADNVPLGPLRHRPELALREHLSSATHNKKRLSTGTSSQHGQYQDFNYLRA